MSINALQEIRKQAEIALCDMTDIVEYGMIDLEEDRETLLGVRSRLKHILTMACDAPDGVAAERVENGPEPTMVKFFCPRCGKEMWSLVDWEANWDKARRYTWDALDILLVCSDCLLAEIRADRIKETNEN